MATKEFPLIPEDVKPVLKRKSQITVKHVHERREIQGTLDRMLWELKHGYDPDHWIDDGLAVTPEG